MVTINTSEETKEKFKKIKLDYSAKIGNEINEDEFINILLDKFEERKK